MRVRRERAAFRGTFLSRLLIDSASGIGSLELVGSPIKRKPFASDLHPPRLGLLGYRGNRVFGHASVGRTCVCPNSLFCVARRGVILRPDRWNVVDVSKQFGVMLWKN